jgi:hypothetical protein
MIKALANPRFVAADQSVIDFDATFDDDSIHPFSASAVDSSTSTFHAKALNGDYGVVASYVPPVLSSELLRAYANSLLATKMVDGKLTLTLSGERTLLVSLDSLSRSALGGIVRQAAVNEAYSTVWSESSGSTTVNATDIEAIDAAVTAHDQALFAAVASIIGAINAGTITTRAEIDAASWPAIG